MLARMRGASKRLDLGDTPMPFFDSFGKFDSNVAHSCKAGVRMYPHGNRPPKEARGRVSDTPMPFFDSFGKFDSNVAHSCKAGVRMYPHGNRPPKEVSVMQCDSLSDSLHSCIHGSLVQGGWVSDTPMPFFDSFGKFDGNVAHSCKAGVLMYPHGNRPPNAVECGSLGVIRH
ncbi:unnamed protein product, partial [Closterium sp. NIES-53]